MLKRDELVLLDETSMQSCSDNEHVISALMLQLDKFNEVDAEVQRKLKDVKRQANQRNTVTRSNR